MSGDPTGRAVLITGCSSGIGYRCAHGLAKRGFRVIASARKPEDVERLAAEGLETVSLDLDDADSVAAIRHAVERGVNWIDTAAVYGNGHSEKVLGKAIGNRRSEAQILSKVFSNHLKYDQVIAACERSLANLQTDYIDLYQIHWPSGSFGSPVVPIEETMRALNALKEQGKTIIMVTHEASVAGHARRIIHMRDGKISADENTNRGGAS